MYDSHDADTPDDGAHSLHTSDWISLEEFEEATRKHERQQASWEKTRLLAWRELQG